MNVRTETKAWPFFWRLAKTAMDIVRTRFRAGLSLHRHRTRSAQAKTM